jgi:predicted ATPase
MEIEAVSLENFKSFRTQQKIPLRNLSLFLGANSSGKSSAIQALMILKQTIECSSPETELLLSGKYANIGDYCDVQNKSGTGEVVIGIDLGQSEEQISGNDSIQWHFHQKDSSDNEAMLSLIELSTPFGTIAMKRDVEDRLYRYYIDETATQYFSRIDNLSVGGILLGYNKEANDLFFEFLKALSSVIFTKKDAKAPALERTSFMPIDGLQDFEQSLIPFFMSTPQVKEEKIEVLELIEKYCKLVSEESFLDTFPNRPLRKILWASAMSGKGKSAQVHKVCEDYGARLSSFLDEHRDCVLDSSYPIRTLRVSQKAGPEKLNRIRSSVSSYNNCVNVLKNKITYLGPIRERPQGLYNIGFEAYPKYVGPTGAFFASVLFHEDKERKYLLPNQREEIMSLSDACAEWLEHIGVASNAKAEKQGSFGIRVAINNLNSQEADIMNVGIGTSQVLPVLLTGLLSSQGDILLFEQPELHLHPFSQSRLVDFFAELARNRRTVVVETHSEHMLLRLRYLLLDEQIDSDKIAIVFFQNEGSTIVKEAHVDGNGSVEYPSDFMDVNEKLIEDLLNKTISKRRTKSE